MEEETIKQLQNHLTYYEITTSAEQATFEFRWSFPPRQNMMQAARNFLLSLAHLRRDDHDPISVISAASIAPDKNKAYVVAGFTGTASIAIGDRVILTEDLHYNTQLLRVLDQTLHPTQSSTGDYIQLIPLNGHTRTDH